MLAVLTTCSSDDSSSSTNNDTVGNNNGPIDATVFADALIGTWNTVCKLDTPNSVQISINFKDGSTPQNDQ